MPRCYQILQPIVGNADRITSVASETDKMLTVSQCLLSAIWIHHRGQGAHQDGRRRVYVSVWTAQLCENHFGGGIVMLIRSQQNAALGSRNWILEKKRKNAKKTVPTHNCRKSGLKCSLIIPISVSTHSVFRTIGATVSWPELNYVALDKNVWWNAVADSRCVHSTERSSSDSWSSTTRKVRCDYEQLLQPCASAAEMCVYHFAWQRGAPACCTWGHGCTRGCSGMAVLLSHLPVYVVQRQLGI